MLLALTLVLAGAFPAAGQRTPDRTTVPDGWLLTVADPAAPPISAPETIAVSGLFSGRGGGGGGQDEIQIFDDGVLLLTNPLGLNFRGFAIEASTGTPPNDRIINVFHRQDIFEGTTRLSQDGASSITFGAGLGATFDSGTGALTVTASGTGAVDSVTGGAAGGLLFTPTTGAVIGSFAPANLPRFATNEPVARSDDLVLKNESAANGAGLIAVNSFLTSIAGTGLGLNQTSQRQLDFGLDQFGDMTEDVAGGDELLIRNISADADQTRTVATYSDHLAGDGLAHVGGGELEVDLDSIDSIQTLAPDDEFARVDASGAGRPTRLILWRNMASALADGTTITASNGVLSAVGSGGGGTDGVVSGAAFASRTLTLNRTQGLADLTATLDDGAFDDRTGPWFRSAPPGLPSTGSFITVAANCTTNGNCFNGRTPAQVRGDIGAIGGTDLPSDVDLSLSGQDLTLTVTMPGRTDLTDTQTLPAGGGGTPFDLHDDVTAENTTVERTDRLLTSAEDVAGDPNQYTTVQGLLDDFNELLPTNTIDTDDYLFFTNTSNTDSPTHKISATDFMTAFPRLVTAPLFAAPDPADEVIIFDVSDSNAVKRLSVSNLTETVRDGVVDGGSVAGETLTLTRTHGLADLDITGLPQPDGVATAGTYDAANDEIDFTVSAPGADFSVDVSGLGGGGTADGVVDGGSVTGTTLTLTRTVGADVTISGLPSGGGGGSSPEVLAGPTTAVDYTSNVAANVNNVPFNRALVEADDDSFLVVSASWTNSVGPTDQRISWVMRAGEFRALGDQGTTTPTTLDESMAHFSARPGNTALNSFAEGRWLFWRGTDASNNTTLFYQVGGVQGGSVMQGLVLTVRLVSTGGGGGGSADGVADSVDLDISGSDLTLTVGRTVGADLTDTVTLPAGGGGTTTVLTRAQAEDGTSAVEGTVTGELLADAINVHATAGHSIMQVSQLPDTETDAVLYLTHDYYTGARADLSITPSALTADFEGWSDGQLYAAGGILTGGDPGCVVAAFGVILPGQQYRINQVWSYNRSCFADVDGVKIGATTYTNIQLRASLGAWVLTVEGAPTIGGGAVDFNLRRSDGSWLYQSATGTLVREGLYDWDSDENTYLLVYSGPALRGLDFSGSNGIRSVTTGEGDTALFLDFNDLATGTGALALDNTFIASSTGTQTNVVRRDFADFVSAAMAPDDFTVSVAGVATLDTVPVAKGGTGSTTAQDARAALGANNAGNLTAGTLPDGRLASEVTRDNELPNNLQADYTGSTLTVTLTMPTRADLVATATIATGGVGDITGIQTDTTSGLAGGCGTGTCDLELDIERLTAVNSWSPLDYLAYHDSSNNGTRRGTLSSFGTYFAGATDGGIDVDGSGRFRMDPTELAGIDNIAPGDIVPLGDTSAGTGGAVNVLELGEYYADETTTTADTVTGEIGVRMDGAAEITTLDGSDVILVGDASAGYDPRRAELLRLAPILAGNALDANVDGALDVNLEDLVDDTGDGLIFTSSNDLLLHARELQAIGADLSRDDLLWVTDIVSGSVSENRDMTFGTVVDVLSGSGLESNGTAIDIADDAIGSPQMRPPVGTGHEGKVMLINSSGNPEWSHPFEFPSTVLRRDVSATRPTDILLLTSTIHTTSRDQDIDVSATVTVTQTGSGSCRVAFYELAASSPFGFTTVTSSAGEATMTITATSSQLDPSTLTDGGSGTPITLLLDTGTGSGTTCAVDSGEASLTLSTS